MLRALIVLVLATAAAVAAPSGALDPKPGSQDAAATSALEKIVAARDNAARKALVDELMKLGPSAIAGLDAWLARPHAEPVAQRREVLTEIKAQVPDSKGRFPTPPRQSAEERQENDELDWLAKLLQLPPGTPGLGEVIADVAAIRALAASNDITAARPIFEAAFRDETMIYRDECGRFLRRMEPYSIPFLTQESQSRGDRRRYANYQLERIDRQEPLKALGAAESDEELMIAILAVFRETKLREAVHAVWKRVDNPRTRVREAARATWMDYITGPPPKPAPTKRLQLPGGKLTKKPKPLWLTYRELADNELRQAANELLGEAYEIADPTSLTDHDPKPVEKIDLEVVTKRLFDYFDGLRAKQDAAEWASAKAKADGGDLAAAAVQLDRMLAQNPQRAERAEMAAIYFAYGRQLADGGKWPDAAAAYSKAHGLDPKGANATDALAAHHYALGKALEAQGKDGGADFRKAIALKPDYEPAQEAEAESASGTPRRPVWMLYAAGLAAAFAAVLFAAAMMRRRA